MAELTINSTLADALNEMHEAQEQDERRPFILVSLWHWLFGRHEASEYEDYFEDVDPITFRLNPAIWNCYRKDRPGIDYYRELHTAYEMLLRRMGDLSLYDPEELKAQNKAIHRRNCELEKELAIANGQIEILQERLNWALDHQTANGKRTEVLTAEGREEEIKAATEPKPQKEGNRFTSNNGSSKMENMMQACAYFESKWTLEEIGEKLHISPNTAKVYISSMRKHYRVEFVQGRKYICFDKEYGYTKWDLCFYLRLEEKFTDSSNLAAAI